MIYFHRRTGVAFACDTADLNRLKERLRVSLGEKFVEGEWDTLHTPLGGALRIRALDKGHLDITSVWDDRLIL